MGLSMYVSLLKIIFYLMSLLSVAWLFAVTTQKPHLYNDTFSSSQNVNQAYIVRCRNYSSVFLLFIVAGAKYSYSKHLYNQFFIRICILSFFDTFL